MPSTRGAFHHDLRQAGVQSQLADIEQRMHDRGMQIVDRVRLGGGFASAPIRLTDNSAVLQTRVLQFPG